MLRTGRRGFDARDIESALVGIEQGLGVAESNGPTPVADRAPTVATDLNNRSWVTSRTVFATVVLIGLAVRVVYSLAAPRNTQDLSRGLVTGKAVWEHGLQAAGKPLLDTFPWATPVNGVPWSHLPYNYPPVPVGFFTLVAAVGGSALIAKVLLAFSDAICAWLIARLTGRPALGLFYWVSPVAMWWTSHEGQFETLQSAFALGALATLHWPIVCGLLIALAVQTKLTAAALLPFLAWRAYKRGHLQRFLIGGAIGAVPTVALSFVYPIIPNIFRHSMQFRWNPYYWNFASSDQFWSPYTLIGRVVPQILSWLLIGWLVLATGRSRSFAAAIAAFGFAFFMKFYGQIPPWYMVTLPLMLVPLAMRPDEPGPASGRTWSLPAGFRHVWVVAVALETPTILYLLQATFSP